ncbi:hypothetical protein ACTWPT_56155 [Nonomuraea sp. 3N208]|uniref:hypothetical protein n=1 Tax=Nonomuraea sp. 3N208 TaxID=3457421 RepID=UPI003FD40CF6
MGFVTKSLAAHPEGHPDLEDLRHTDAKTFDASERLAAEGAASVVVRPGLEIYEEAS